MPDIIPAIFEKEWDQIVQKVDIIAPYVEWVQIDFSDGTLVPAQTFFDLGKFRDLIKTYDQHGNGRSLHFEAHLMVASPEKFARKLGEVGFERIIAQAEASDPRLFLEEAKLESVELGLAIDSTTELDEVEPFLEELDVVLVMMAEAGATRLVLQPENVEKVRAVRQHFPDLPIEAEEGITHQTAKVLADAGATRLVATSVLFDHPDEIAHAIESLKNI